MPPRTRVSAPASRVYKSSTPLQQAKFPNREKRTTYGKTTTRRPPLLKKQDTLTQMDFIKMQQLQEMAAMNDASYDEVEVEPRRKRRKTTGDLGDQSDKENQPQKLKSKKVRRKTDSDRPLSTPQYHTQTITQVPDWLTPAPTTEEGDFEEGFLQEPAQIKSDEAEKSFDDTIFDVPTSSQLIAGHTRNRNLDKPKAITRSSSPVSETITPGLMGPPQTPRRRIAPEIPSSESPVTPVASSHSRLSGERSASVGRLQTIPIPFNPGRRAQPTTQTHPKLEIKDTFDTTSEESQMILVASSPSKHSSAAKSVRFVLPKAAEDLTPIYAATAAFSKEDQSPVTKVSKLEISDSDEDSDEEIELSEFSEQGDVDEDVEMETCYGTIGEETQLEMSQILSSSLSPIIEDDRPRNGSKHRPSPDDVQGSPELPEFVTNSCIGTFSNDIIKEAQSSPGRSSPSLPLEDMQKAEEPLHTYSERRTQHIESQRLATQHIMAMAPRTPDSDVFVVLDHRQLQNILDRTKNHDIRNWAYPPSVSRIWMYEPRPTARLKYMAAISDPRRPGEVADDSGIGNLAFNAKKGAGWHAYEIMELYELADPLSHSELKAKEWLIDPPKRFHRVPPVVLDSLMANLLPPLFTQHELEGEPTSSSTDTQEAEAQLLNNMKQFTQAVSSPSQVPQAPEVEMPFKDEFIPSSQPALPPNKFSQATTVDLSQSQAARGHIRDIVWESPTRPVPFSTPMRLLNLHSMGLDPVFNDSVVPFSLASSQVLTKSQMVPASYLEDSIPGPPLYVEDSGDEVDI